jgi:protein-tyrosine phosphatase
MFEGIQYLDLVMNDSLDQDLTQPIVEALNFIIGAKKFNLNSKIIIHCHQGLSRSISMAVAYLMNSKNWSRDEALEYIANLKDDICPNINFCYQLLQLEPHIRVFYKKADCEGITYSDMDTDTDSSRSTPQ